MRTKKPQIRKKYGLAAFLVSPARFERAAFRLGVWLIESYTVSYHAVQCYILHETTMFYIGLFAVWYSVVSCEFPLFLGVQLANS